MSLTNVTRLSFLLRLRDRADTMSWPEFHGRYGHLLYRYARGRGANHADAEDIVQEVEMQFFKAIDGFEYDARKGRFRGYLRTAVVHAMARRANRERRQPAELDPHTFDHVARQQAEVPDEQWETEWQLQRLRWALQSIAEEFDAPTLKAFEMHVLAGVPAPEVAERLGVSKWCVYRAKNRLLERLKATLDQMDPDGDA